MHVATSKNSMISQMSGVWSMLINSFCFVGYFEEALCLTRNPSLLIMRHSLSISLLLTELWRTLMIPMVTEQCYSVSPNLQSLLTWLWGRLALNLECLALRRTMSSPLIATWLLTVIVSMSATWKLSCITRQVGNMFSNSVPLSNQAFSAHTHTLWPSAS